MNLTSVYQLSRGALFAGTRSSAANIAGQNIANPASYLIATADMLKCDFQVVQCQFQ